ncbi:hypothetical protein POTOM_032430 [Populus tomentosa]|uniref:Uncharacterized protein n=1 Tax=Populus tomentosa TaxID=118781 RepID=A0A8X7Z5Z5_POPTO|nr:hypothetical protein POTOM_032430 [Populus tomentosa]
MDFSRNLTVSGEYHHQQEHVLACPPPCSKLAAAAASNSPLDDLFSAQNTVVSGEYHHPQEHVLASPPPCSKLTAAAASNSPLDDLFSAQNTSKYTLLSLASIDMNSTVATSSLHFFQLPFLISFSFYMFLALSGYNLLDGELVLTCYKLLPGPFCRCTISVCSKDSIACIS